MHSKRMPERVYVDWRAYVRPRGDDNVAARTLDISRTGVLTKSAKHAAAKVVGEGGELLATGGGIAFTADHNQVLRTGEGAKVAGNAQGFIGIGIDVEPRRSPIPFRNLRALQRILLGIDLLGVLITKGYREALEEIEEQHFP